MSPQAARAAEEQGLPKFPGMGIGEGQRQPPFRNHPLEIGAIELSLGSAVFLLLIILEADPFHLSFAGAGFTGINDRFTAHGVQGEFVSGDLPFPAAGASAPPVGIASLGASFRGPHHRELSVDLADTVPGGRRHCAGVACVRRSTALNKRIN